MWVVDVALCYCVAVVSESVGSVGLSVDFVADGAGEIV